MKKIVTVMLARLPTGEDYKRVGLSSGMFDGYIAEGNQIINALMPQFNDNLRVEWDDNPALIMPDYRQPGDACIHFECDAEGFEGTWYLPADLFTIRDNFNLKD